MHYPSKIWSFSFLIRSLSMDTIVNKNLYNVLNRLLNAIHQRIQKKGAASWLYLIHIQIISEGSCETETAVVITGINYFFCIYIRNDFIF